MQELHFSMKKELSDQPYSTDQKFGIQFIINAILQPLNKV